jgi:hypothetical protein
MTARDPNQTLDLWLIIAFLVVVGGVYAVGFARGARRRPDSDAWTTGFRNGFRNGWQSRQRIANRRPLNERPSL